MASANWRGGGLKRGGRLLVRILMWAAIVYVALVVLLIVNETRLVYPAPRFPVGNWQPTAFEFEDVWFESTDGTRLHGWYLPRESAEHIVLIFHGNAEHVPNVSAGLGLKIANTLNAAVFAFDYRGYGRSEGQPFESGLIQDGAAALQWICKREQCSPEDVIVYGRSLGGGVALGVASEIPVKAVLLDRTFDSMTATAAAQYPWVPVSWLMRNRYDSISRIRNCEMPTFISHFENDELISIEQASRLFDASPAALKRFYSMPGGGHLHALPSEYWNELKRFVDAVEQERLVANSSTARGDN